mmetsp:Transcript_40717/g.88972  ORF Transcript_40717/g.88972 Transcript_40717/m.88972 type:complete len:378 (-) Transcript_40717:68-1201(-)
MFGVREGLFECCSPQSVGEPEFLTQEQHITTRAAENLVTSASGSLKLYFQHWPSERRHQVRAAVFIHPGEVEHSGWYNGLAMRLAGIGCSSFALDPQGFGQSDGARGYFECFDDLVEDYVEFCKQKWDEVVRSQSKSSTQGTPGLVLVGKGFGALVVMRAVVELHELTCSWGVTPTLVLVAPAFQFAAYINDQNEASCGLNSTQAQCARQPAAQCARVPAAVAFTSGDQGPTQKLEHMSRWFPKMIVTRPVDADMVSRDPQTVDRMSRDVLCWRQGYRARALAEVTCEQAALAELMAARAEVFEYSPALILHGGGDQLFDVRGSHRLHSIWCDTAQRTGLFPRLKIYDGAFHQLLNEPNKDEVLNDIVQFVHSKISG